MSDKTDYNKNQEPSLGDLISLRDASKISGLSQPHLSLLIRQGKLWGQKIGRNWVTTEQAIRKYLALNIKPGPKSKKNP
jgi:hypothetical protein